eukprot:PhM_4_TR3375/c2_g1_i8/m.90639
MKPTFEVKSTLMPRGKVTEQCHFSGDGYNYAEKRVQRSNKVSEDAPESNNHNNNKGIHYPQNECTQTGLDRYKIAELLVSSIREAGVCQKVYPELVEEVDISALEISHIETD